MSHPTIAPRYVPIEAVGNYLSVSRTTVYKLIRDGKIFSSMVGARRVVDLHSVDDYVERSRDNLGGPAAAAEGPGCAG